MQNLIKITVAIFLSSCSFSSKNISPQRSISYQDKPINYIQSCIEKRKDTKMKCVTLDRKRPCSKTRDEFTEPISYCIFVKDGLVNMNKEINIYFNHKASLFTPNQAQNRFKDAFDCMEKFYLNYNIKLNLVLTEVDENSDITKVELSQRTYSTINSYEIPLVHKKYKLTSDNLCIALTHEISHHLGLPDRYKSRSCPLREVNTGGITGVSYKSIKSLRDMKLILNDVELLLEPLECD